MFLFFHSEDLVHWKQTTTKDNFDDADLALARNFLRNPYDEDFSLTQRPGYLRLNGSAVTLNDRDSRAFVGRRQTYLACRASARLDFNPKAENEEAGLIIRGNEKNHYDIGLTLRQGKRKVFCRKVLGGKVVDPVNYIDISDGDVILSIKASPLSYRFYCQSHDGKVIHLASALTRDLSSEKIGGFTGVYFGMYATVQWAEKHNPGRF